jgi:hypothetical protein
MHIERIQYALRFVPCLMGKFGFIFPSSIVEHTITKYPKKHTSAIEPPDRFFG